MRAGAGHGVAIDAHMTLELDARRARVHGAGAVHRLKALGAGRVAVTALLAGGGFEIRTANAFNAIAGALASRRLRPPADRAKRKSGPLPSSSATGSSLPMQA